MRNTSTLVLLTLGLALGAYVYFVELRGEERRERAATAERRLVTLERDSITALSLPLDGGGVAELARESGGEWQLVSPVAFPADQGAVDRALDALDRLEFTSEIDASADLSAYGLAEGEGARVEAPTSLIPL